MSADLAEMGLVFLDESVAEEHPCERISRPCPREAARRVLWGPTDTARGCTCGPYWQALCLPCADHLAALHPARCAMCKRFLAVVRLVPVRTAA